MDASLDYDNHCSLFTLTLKGDLNKEGLVNSINLYTGHPQWKDGAKIIIDYRECSLKNLTPAEIQDMAEATSDLSDKIGRAKIGIIMSDQHDYGMARFWQIKTEKKSSITGKIFINPELAKEWLLT